MFVRPEDDPRSDTGFDDERATLVGFLRDQRLTLELKCSGLDPADLARRSVPPSNLSLLGLLRHMAAVEQTWFRIRMAGHDEPRLFRSEDDRDLDFNGAVPDPVVVAEAWRACMPRVCVYSATLSAFMSGFSHGRPPPAPRAAFSAAAPAPASPRCRSRVRPSAAGFPAAS